MAQLTLQQINKTYDNGAEIIRNLDLEIEAGELMVFVGPSGCGKSTLLRMIAGLEAISGGEMCIDGKRMNGVPPANRGVAMVFQSYALYPHMSVADNMGFSLQLEKRPRAEIAQRVKQAAEVLQIQHLLERKPRELSGGQRQRVAIGRAIVRKPRVFLLDEPLSNLDAALRVQMRTELVRLQRELRTTMIYVTHDQVEAMTMGDRIAVFNGGHIEQVGTPMDLYKSPANLFVAGFLGSPKMNLIPARFMSGDGGSTTVELPDGTRVTLPLCGRGIQAGAMLTFGIRPEHLNATDGVPLHGTVDLLERLGESTLVHYRIANHASALIARLPGDSKPLLDNGRTLFRADPQHCHLFDAQGIALQDAVPE